MSETSKQILKIAFCSAKRDGIPWASCGSKVRVSYLRDAKAQLNNNLEVQDPQKDDVLADIEAFFGY